MVLCTGAALGLIVGLAQLPSGEAAEGPSCRGMAPTIMGTDGPDHLQGTDGPDVIFGAGGDDQIIAGGGDDLICSGTGNDQIWAGGGNDFVDADAGDDLVSGDAGDDELWGGGGGDQVDGGAGVDLCDAEQSGNCESGATAQPIPTTPAPTTPQAAAPQATPQSAAAPEPTVPTQPAPQQPTTLGAAGTIQSLVAGPESTGVPPGVELLPQSGLLVITDPGAVIENVDLTGCIRIKADNITIRKSRIRCSGENAAVWQSTGFTGLVIEDSEIFGAGQSPTGAGVWSSDQDGYTMRRTEIANVGDGAFVGSGSVLEGNWIHDLHVGGGVHNDLIQMVGGSNVSITGNRLEHNQVQTSAIMIKADLAPIKNVEISGNRIAGGSFSVYVHGGAHGTPDGVQVRNNTVVAGSYLYGPMVIQGSTAPSCNRHEDGTLITVARTDRGKGAFVNPC